MTFLKRIVRRACSRRSLGILATILCIAASLAWYVHQSSVRFESAYGEYAALARENAAAAFLPGIADNPVRKELNQILTRLLTKAENAAKNRELAKRGLELLDESEIQIDAIGSTGEALAVALVKMDLAANTATDLSSKGAMREIVALAERRAEIVGDIRGLSYRANFETGKIFQRILDEGGAVSDAHVRDLNAALPEIEEQFNKRAELYSELQNIDSRIADARAAL
jgi:hypothetical protein